MAKIDPKQLSEEILSCEAGSQKQIDLVVQEFHLKIKRYLKRGYWTYVEESLRSAIRKVQGRWPGQQRREIPNTHLRLGREITGEQLTVKDLAELASEYPETKLFVYEGSQFRRLEPVRYLCLYEPSNSGLELRIDYVEKPKDVRKET